MALFTFPQKCILSVIFRGWSYVLLLLSNWQPSVSQCILCMPTYSEIRTNYSVIFLDNPHVTSCKTSYFIHGKKIVRIVHLSNYHRIAHSNNSKSGAINHDVVSTTSANHYRCLVTVLSTESIGRKPLGNYQFRKGLSSDGRPYILV